MIVENARKYGIGPRIPTVIAVAVVLALGAMVFSWVGIWWKIRKLFVITAMIEGIIFFLPHIVTTIGILVAKKRNGGKLPESVITVSDRIIYKTDIGECVYELCDLTETVRMKYSYKCRFTNRRSLLVDTNGFTKGTFEEFKEFLRKNCINAVISD